jgi:hypothetical protein
MFLIINLFHHVAFLACLSSGLDSKTTSQHNLIPLVIFELQHPTMVNKNFSKHRNEANYISEREIGLHLFLIDFGG